MMSSAAETAAFAANGFRVIELIGQGTQSSVYLVEKANQTFALKVHRRRADSAFNRESASLASVRSPHIAEIYEVGETDGKPFIVMEYVDGPELRSLIEAGTVDERRAIELVKQIAQALVEVHGRGLIHRDLKPENILTTRAGAVKLIDFGFADHELIQGREGTSTASTGLRGTPTYCSPEQLGLLGNITDARSDLYTVGIILFELLTGRRPFAATSLNELIEAHLNGRVPSAGELGKVVSPGVQLILDKLLAKNPDDRYSSARGLIYDLEKVDVLTVAGAFEREQAFHLPLPLVGRRSEFQEIEKCWVAAKNGAVQVALISGSSGSGKSRLALELASRVRGDGNWVFVSKCAEHMRVPFGFLRESFQYFLNTLGSMPEERAEKLRSGTLTAMGEQRPLLLVFFPELVRLLPDNERVQWIEHRAASKARGEPGYIDTSNAASSEEALAALVCAFVVRWIGTLGGPAMFWVDDVQWIDAASLRLVAGIVQKSAHIPCLILSTSRSEPEYDLSLGHWKNACADLLKADVSLSPLKSEATFELIRECLGGRDFNRELSDEIHAKTEGSPLAVQEFLKAMLEEGVLRPAWKSWIVELQKLSNLKLPSNVSGLIASRIKKLNSTTFEVLKLLSLWQGKMTLPALQPLFAVSIQGNLEEAIQAGVLERRGGGTLDFVHDKLREACVAAILPQEVRVLHQKLAEHLYQKEHQKDWDPDSLTFALAEHHCLGDQSKDPRLVFELNLKAAQRAAEQVNFSATEKHAVAAEKCLMEFGLKIADSWRAKLFDLIGDARYATHQLKSALEYYTKALALAQDPISTADGRRKLVQVYNGLNDYVIGMREVYIGLKDIGKPHDRVLPVEILAIVKDWIWGLILSKTGWRFGAAQGFKRQVLIKQLQIYSAALPAALFNNQVFFLIARGLRGLLAGHLLGPSRELVEAYASYSMAMANIGKARAAQAFIDRAIALAQQLKDPHLVNHAKIVNGVAFWILGDFPRSRAIQAEIVERELDLVSSSDRRALFGPIGWEHMFRGYFHEAAKAFSQLGENTPALIGYQLISKFPLGHVSAAAATFFKNTDWRSVQEYVGKIELISHTLSHWTQTGDLDHDTGEIRAELKKMNTAPNTTPHPGRHVWLSLANYHLARFERDVSNVAEKKIYFEQVKLLSKTAYRIFEPMAEFHCAKRAFYQGKKISEVYLILDRAQANAVQIDHALATFEIHAFRSQLLRDQGKIVEGRSELETCRYLATKLGWVNQLAWVDRNMRRWYGSYSGNSVPSGEKAKSSTSVLTLSASTESLREVQLGRQLEAVLEVSRASSAPGSALDRYRAVLDQLTRILGAERAILMLDQTGSGKVVPVIGRDSERRDLVKLEGYSTTLISQVIEGGAPVVVTGTEDGEISTASSVIAHQLKSMIATPLKTKKSMVGVVYLDNRLAKGIFQNEHLSLLQAISSHLAIEFERALSDQREIEMRALEKDLELTGVVQSMLLPKKAEFSNGSVRLVGHYQPAARSGGDWWWYDYYPSISKLRVLVGDATGHGAGSAMVTGVISSAYQTLKASRGSNQKVPELSETMNLLHTISRQLCGEKYWMTMAGVEFDLENRKLTWVNAAAPPLLVRKREGKVTVLAPDPSTPIGSPELKLATSSHSLDPGDRLLICTDGLVEGVLPNGTQLGMRNLRGLVAEQGGVSDLREASRQMIQKFDQFRGTEPLHDDVTAIYLEV